MKKLIALLACIYLVGHLSACTSTESQGDDAAVTEDGASAVEETAAVDGELEKVDEPAATEVAKTDETNAGFVDEQLPEQALGEAPPAEAPPAVVASEEPPPAPETMVAEAPPAEAAPIAASEPEAPPMIDAGESKPAPIAAAEPKPKASLKKVREAPFREGGQLLNAVYIARPGDTYKKIATNIYGDSKRQKDLKKANPAISSPKAGDKIYYNSPTRSTDEATMVTYYEENGMPPEMYVAKEGDNLKKISKELLGFDGAWKEIWVTNQGLESKESLIAGTELKYWKSVPVSTTPPATTTESLAKSDLPPPPQDMAAANTTPPVEQLPPPPQPADVSGQQAPTAAASTVAQNELPPPPPANELPPPPPPMVEKAPPPPPPPTEVAANKKPKVAAHEEEAFSNDDMMMGLAGIGLVAAAVAFIMFNRKRRQQKEMAAAFGDTQIGAS